MSCKDRALKYLAIRMRSEFEMRTYLYKKGYTRAEIDEAIEFLYSYNYLDDLAFAKAFIKDKINFSPCGRNKIYADLRKRGVNSNLIKEALAENFDKDLEIALAENLLNKQLRISDDKNKQAQFLKNKGFSYAVISHLIDFYEN